VILEPINDVQCLSQLTTIARELAATTLVRTVAQHLGTREEVIRWLQSKPQTDDDGREAVQYIACDVPQRVRLLANDPNCVERATDAMMLLEALEQLRRVESTGRALATIDRPVRHTGLVEKHGEHWLAVDLFPRRNGRRNFDWSSFGVGALKGVHQYVGKPILKFYGLGSVADTIGDQENKLTAKAPEKQSQPSSTAVAQRPAVAQGGSPGADAAVNFILGKGGLSNAETQTRKPESDRSPLVAATAGGIGDARSGARAAAPAAARSDRDSHDAGAEAQRFRDWWGLQ
jgi:hypothetical protein